MVDTLGPDISFLQETMGSSHAIKYLLESLLVGWSFEPVDARGCSGGLDSGWQVKSYKCEGIWGWKFSHNTWGFL